MDEEEVVYRQITEICLLHAGDVTSCCKVVIKLVCRNKNTALLESYFVGHYVLLLFFCFAECFVHFLCYRKEKKKWGSALKAFVGTFFTIKVPFKISTTYFNSKWVLWTDNLKSLWSDHFHLRGHVPTITLPKSQPPWLFATGTHGSHSQPNGRGCGTLHGAAKVQVTPLQTTWKIALNFHSTCTRNIEPLLHTHSSSANKSKVTVNLQNIKELFALLVMSAPSSTVTLFSLRKHIHVT